MFVKPLERADARRLRSEGMSIKKIAAILEVSPSSVLAWTKDIELTPRQKHIYGAIQEYAGFDEPAWLD